MDAIAKWLATGIEVAGISQVDLAKAIGVEKDRINKVLSGKRNLTAAEMLRVAALLDRPLPIKSVAGDIRPMSLTYSPDFPEDNIEIAGQRPAISAEHRFMIPQAEIPQIDGTIGLGSRSDVEMLEIQLDNGQSVAAAPVLGSWRIPPSVLQRRVRTSIEHLHLVECEGNSMYPLIKDGDVVLVDQSRRNPTMPGIFALWENGGQTIKQVEIVRGTTDPTLYRLIPANKDYTTYEVSADDVTIIGRYVARFTVD